MNRKSRILFIVGIICVGIFLYISRIAFADTNVIDEAVNNLKVIYPTASETPILGGPGFISINSYAFQPYFPSDLYTRYGQLLSCAQAECLFSTGVNLPHGATITKLSFVFIKGIVFF